MHGLAHHIVNAGGEKLQRIVERLSVVHGDDCGRRARLDFDGDFFPVLKIAQKKCFNGANIGLWCRVDPLPEILRRKARRRHAFTAKPRRVAV